MQAPRIQAVRDFTRQDLIDLADAQNTPCISLYMPTELASTSGDAARIRLKNLLRQAEKKIGEGNDAAKTLLPMIEKARRLMTGPDFCVGAAKGWRSS